MKTWHRILTVAVLLVIIAALGANKALEIHRANAWKAHSLSNLKMIGIALEMYADDYNNVFPDLSDAESMTNALGNYVGGAKPFVHLKTGHPYQPNPSLSYKERKGSNASAYVVIVYEADPAQDGTRAMLFTDGDVQRVNESRWQELKKSSNIP